MTGTTPTLAQDVAHERFVVTVTPNPSLDLSYRLADGDSLTREDLEVHRAVEVTLEASGKGVNVSRTLAMAGVPGAAVFPAGGATGAHLADLLARDGVPCRAVPVGGDTRVNTSVLEPRGRTVKVNGAGSPLLPQELGAVRDAAVGAVAEGTGERWLLVCGSLPAGAPPDLVGSLVEAAHAAGAACAVDTSGAALEAALRAGADLLAPNRAELAEVVPWAAGDLTDPSAHLDTVCGTIARVAASVQAELIVSMGADGAVWTDGRQIVHARGPQVVPVNTAGAGDALLSGWFATAGDPAARLQAAVTWGTAACLTPTTVLGRDALDQPRPPVRLRRWTRPEDDTGRQAG